MSNAETSLFLFLLGLLGVNWPLLEIFNNEAVTYLMAFWFVFIIAVALAAHLPGNGAMKTGKTGRQMH